MKIALININPNEVSSKHIRINTPLGICYISSYLKSKGYNVDIIDTYLIKYRQAELIDTLIKKNYDLIGFTVMYRNAMLPITQIIKGLRNFNCGAHITLGGHYPTFDYEYILETYSDIDSIVRYEGEHAFYQLVKSIINGEDLSNVPNLAYRHNGVLRCSKKITFVEDLDSLPLPDLLLYEKNLKTHKQAEISSSRGCYGNCSFCSISAFYRDEGCAYRERSVDGIIREMKLLHENYGITEIEFVDDNFFGLRKTRDFRLNRFCDLLETLSYDFFIQISIRANDYNENLVKRLCKNGLIILAVGVESGNKNSLRLYNKGTSVEENYTAIKGTYSHGIIPVFGFIFFEPNLSLNDAMENHVFLRSISDFVILSFRHYSTIIEVYNGTSIEKIMLEDHAITRNDFTISEGYKYKLKDKDAGTLLSVFKAINEKIINTEVTVSATLMGVWKQIIVLQKTYDVDLDEVLSDFHEIRKKNNYNIISIVDDIFKYIKDNSVITEEKILEYQNKRNTSNNQTLSELNYMRITLPTFFGSYS